jgi:predicted Zn-dependent protease
MRAFQLAAVHLAGAAVLLLTGCGHAPVTGRQQLLLVSDAQVATAGAQAFQEIVQEKGTSDDPTMNATIQRVGARVAQASDGAGLTWQFRLINDDTANAFALPGGLVGVNTGLFKVVQSDDQLAAVLGHEIAHVTAHHHAERMSRQALVQTGLTAISGETSPATVELLKQAATLGVVLPFSREQEAEADHIGLIYMARAGYDPHAAVAVWQNFEKLGGTGQPTFLSTHPSPGDRIAELEKIMPQADAIYQGTK